MARTARFLMLIALLSLPHFGFGATKSQAQHSGAMMMPMPMVAPLFLENSEFSSTLYMVNELSIPTRAKVTLFDLSGTMVAQRTVDFKPNSQQQVRIRLMLESANSAASLGSLQMLPLTSNGIGVLASLGITHYGTQQTYFDEELTMPSTEGLRRYVQLPKRARPQWSQLQVYRRPPSTCP